MWCRNLIFKLGIQVLGFKKKALGIFAHIRSINNLIYLLRSNSDLYVSIFHSHSSQSGKSDIFYERDDYLLKTYKQYK